MLEVEYRLLEDLSETVEILVTGKNYLNRFANILDSRTIIRHSNHL